MRLSRCILTLAACMGVSVGLSLGTARLAAANCGDGVTSSGEACDNGTPSCQAGSKNIGAECHKSSDCTGVSATPGTGGPGDLCQCLTATCRNGIGNRDDIASPNAGNVVCRSNCMGPMCGDGVSDANEQCDNGANNGDTKPCLGSAPNTVCSSKAVPGLVLNNPLMPGNNATVKCASDGDCFMFLGAAECKGNPQCHLAACGDSRVCSDPTCTTGRNPLGTPPGAPAPEGCDDGNTSNMDGCTSFNALAVVGGTPAIPDACQPNACGDGLTNMGVEQCDSGTAVCLSGPNANKPCCTNADCRFGNDTSSLCSASVGVGNGNVANECRCGTCNFPSCGDGISDSGEQCDLGTSNNGPHSFCVTERLCVGGENPGAKCTTANDCIKGTCGPLQCIQNKCGDGLVGGNEQCDDGNTATGDSCGLSGSLTDPTTACGAKAAALHCDTDTVANTSSTGGPIGTENNPGQCAPCACLSAFCGDGVTGPGEMCDSGTSHCSASSASPNLPCTKSADCKCIGGPCPAGTCAGGNLDDTPNACRSNCMPPACGDGVSDNGEQCEPPAAGTFCIKNAAGQCVLATCGDDDVCNKAAVDAATHLPRLCTTGPGGGPEQCDDSNTVEPNATNTDTCFSSTTTTTAPNGGACAATRCGDGITTVGEQCDSTTMGCSNMAEDLSNPEVTPDCCIDGNVVDHTKVGPPNSGLISVNTAFTALLGCRMPHLVGVSACDARLSKSLAKIQARILSAQIFLQNNDITRARRLMRSAELRLNSLSARVARVTKPGGACAAQAATIANMKGNAANLVIGIVSHLSIDNVPFGP